MSSKRINLASNVVAPCAIILATFVLFDQCLWFLALISRIGKRKRLGHAAV